MRRRTARLVVERVELVLVNAVHVLDVPEPAVDEAERLRVECRLDAAGTRSGRTE